MIMKKRKGFTLIEVIVSILLTVMTVLAAHAGITSSMRITTESYRKRAAIHETENIMKCLSTENFVSALNLYADAFISPDADMSDDRKDEIKAKQLDIERVYNTENENEKDKKVYLFFDKDNQMIDSVEDKVEGETQIIKFSPFGYNEIAMPRETVWWICIDFADVTRTESNADYIYTGPFKIHAETVRGAVLYEANFEK